MLTAFTGHGTLLNSKALQLVAIDESIQNPDGGVFVRDERGRLNGRLEEYAQYLANHRLALKTDPAEVVRIYRQFATEASRVGYHEHAAARRFAASRRGLQAPCRGQHSDSHESVPVSDARGRGGNDGQPPAAAAAAVTARRCARHEMDSRRHADRAVRFHARALHGRAKRQRPAQSPAEPHRRVRRLGVWIRRSPGGSCVRRCRDRGVRGRRRKRRAPRSVARKNGRASSTAT